MKICVIGSGYVGLVTAVCLADFGNEVACIDKDIQKVKSLNNGFPDFYELGLKEMIARNLKSKRINFLSLSSLKQAVQNAEVIFIAVGTPPLASGDADLSAITETVDHLKRSFAAARKNKNKYRLVVVKSTVPVGTSEMISKMLSRRNTAVVSNPEFLREGHAIYDFLHPERIILGCEDKKASAILAELYRPLNARVIFMSRRSAELVKYASNAFLASKISFINEIACVCERLGANIKEVAEGMGHDSRIGQAFLRAGIGYGGSCLPKDVSALIYQSQEAGHEPLILKSVNKTNTRQRDLFVSKVTSLMNKHKGKTLAIWGLAFKPQTDDLRDAPSLHIIKSLLRNGFKIRAFDPMTNGKAKKIIANIKYSDDPYAALKGADALLILTEWNEFREADLEKIKSLLKKPIIIDGRNIYSSQRLKELGIKYSGVGV